MNGTASNATSGPFCDAMRHARAAGFARHGRANAVFNHFHLPGRAESDGVWGACVAYAPAHVWSELGILLLPILLQSLLVLPAFVACGVKCGARGHALLHMLLATAALVFLTFLYTTVCVHYLNVYLWVVGPATLMYGLACARRSQKPGSVVACLHNTRCGVKQGKGCAHVHTWVFGRLDEWLQLSVAEGIFALAYAGWLALTFAHYFSEYSAPAWGENSVRAAGRALAQVNIKLLPFIYISVNKDTWLWYFFAVSPERGYLYHKMASRIFVASVIVHVILMIAGGSTDCVAWSDPFDLTRPNLWPGIVALILSVLTAVTALPFIRRQYFEWFYFNHIQVSFPINIFTMFHAREHYFFLLVIVVWIFQIDVMRRLFKKMESSKILSAKMVSRNILRMELARSRRGHLSLGDGSHQNRPGAYLWLSANKLIQSEAASGGGLPPLCIPPADKLKLPSWLHFHPLTIASAPGDKSWVVYIKDEGNYGQWSNALADRARASPRGVDSKPIADMKVRIGGPHGGMRMKPQDYEIVVLCAGGVGATLATAILSDYKTMKSGYARDTGVTTKIVMLWACRSLATFAAFKEELDRAMATRPLNVEYDLRAFLTRDPPADVQAVSVSEDHQNTDGNAYVAPVTTMMTRAEGGGGGGDSAAAAGGAACPELPLDALKAVFDKCAFANKKAKTLYMGREFYEKAVKALPAGSPEAASFASFFGGRAEADKGKGLHISWEDFLMLDVGRKEDYAWIRKEANARLPACLKMQPEVGRPDFRALLAQIKAENAGAKFGAVYACGPNALMLSAAQAAMTVNKDSKPGPVFHHHTEDWEV